MLLVFSTVNTEYSAWSSQAVAAVEEDAKTAEGQNKKKRLSQERYYTLDPFTVPLMSSGEINEQFTIVVAIELAEEENRIDIVYAVPRIRHEVYNELLQLVTFRRDGTAIPQIGVFKALLFKVAKRIIGDKAKAIVVQQAFRAPLK